MRLTLAALTLSFAPMAAMAQEVSISAGFALTSEYVSSGLRYSDGPAFQPYAEAEINGFYAGIWASNLNYDLAGADTEVDLYLGYRGEAGALNYDVGYARYYYLGPTDDCCGEFTLALDYAASDSVSVGTNLAYDPEAKLLGSSVSVDVYPTDVISLAAEYGRNEDSHHYWSLGGRYTLNDTTAVDLTWHDSTIDESIVVLSLTMDFSLR